MSLWKKMIGGVRLAALVGAAWLPVLVAPAGENAASSQQTVRLVWQDGEKNALQWGEWALAGSEPNFELRGEMQGLPELDAERQYFVQMEQTDNVLLAGVRDNDGGKFQSGWVAIDLAGSHPPRFLEAVLDAEQGNPAHLYVYDGQFYLANDHLNGFTRLSPEMLRGPVEGRKGVFHRGGGSHITLAATENRIAYSTWSGRGKEVSGKIDVVDLTQTGDAAIAYSFQLPVGGLHGAIANSGRVFFAPSDGVYWVDADLGFQQTAETVSWNHLSLGETVEGERPLRTGAFRNLGHWVLFNTGSGEHAALCLVDATAAKPAVIKLPIELAEGLSLVSPEAITTADGKRYAFVFQNRRSGGADELLTIVDLDPNGDGDFSDARIAKSLDVAPSRTQGHSGHHAIAFEEGGQWGFLTMPGSGELWVLRLDDLSIVSKHSLGGIPTKIVATRVAAKE